MGQNRNPRDKSMHLLDTLSLTKEARIYNGVKTISLTSGAGKTGQPLVKECGLVLICLFLMTNDVECIFVCLYAVICLILRNVYSHPLPFKN